MRLGHWKGPINKSMLFGIAILATALLLSMVAAYYSVAGLVAIFSAATIPVIIMGGSLELGKIVATVWLHNNWRRAGWAFKAYLIPAVAFLMLLTSMGIFGYLSKAHSDQGLVSGDAIAKVAIYDEKIKISKDNIEANRKALKQMDESVDQVMGRSTDEKGADKAVALRRSQQKERSRLLSEIEAEQKNITRLNEERAPLAAEFRKIESEVGPIKYIASLVYGENPDANVLERAVRLVIIMIVLVFDPLALTLILAANKQFEWARQGRGGFVHDDDDRAAMSIVPPKESDTRPFTEEEVAALNKDPHPPGWMFDNLPYLRDGAKMFFTGLKPLPAQPEVDKTQPEPETQIPLEEDHEESEAIKAAIKKWKSENPHDTIKNQRYKLLRGEITELPWMQLVPDNLPATQPASGFGVSFPQTAARGDTFVRVDHWPSRVYKYNGTDWIEVDKTLSDSYTFDSAYIDHLIDHIASGEYDPDLLTDAEREQIALRLNNNPKT